MNLIGLRTRLTAEDALTAAAVGSVWMLRKLAHKRNSDHGGLSTRGLRLRWADTIHGIMGEIALSRMLNVAWTPGGIEISFGDVGYFFEARATEHVDGHLTLYQRDKDHSLFVLLVGEFPDFRAVGCMRGSKAKNPIWWRADKDPPCWWVPQRALDDLSW